MTELKFNTGDYVKLSLLKRELKGTIIESPDSLTILLKLESGYNIGIPKEKILNLKVLKKFKEEKINSKIPFSKNKKNIGMIVTGGTIASRLDPKTGGVKPFSSIEEFSTFYPEVFKKVNVKKLEMPFTESSENMTWKHWKEIAEISEKMLNDKEIEGIIITHGSDTLHYTSAVLSFFLRNLNKPVVLTFSQRSIDRASSDAKMNLTCSVEMALSNCAEVMIVGHATTNDDFCFALPGTKTRKMHTSRRDTFKSINDKPIAKISPDGKIEFLKTYKPRNKDKVELDTKFTEKVALIKFYPSQSSNILDHYKKEGYKAVVLEMTGLGHVNASWIPKIKSLTKQGFIICATPQTIFGRLNPKVYSVGRELEKAGAIYLKDMLTETAYIKLSWVLGHKTWKTQEKVKEKMLENIEGELSEMLVE